MVVVVGVGCIVDKASKSIVVVVVDDDDLGDM